MTLPTPDHTCGASSPSASCPPVPSVAYEVTLPGGWNPEYAGAFGVPFPALVFVSADTAIDPEPPLPIEGETAFSIPVSDPSAFPTEDSWQVAQPFAEQPFVGAILPLPFIVGPGGVTQPDRPLWFRFRFRDADGCASAVYLFFPNGLPATATEDVELQVFYGPDSEPVVVTVEAAPNDEDEGPQQDVVLTVSPTCPAPARYVPVGPACGAEGIPVEVSAPVEVVNPMNEGGNVPLAVGGSGPNGSVPVSLAGVWSLTQINAGELVGPAGGPQALQAIPDGFAKLIVSGVGPAGSTVRLLMAEGGEIRLDQRADGTFIPFVLDAPAGTVLAGFELSAESPGVSDVYANAVGFYPV